MPWRLILFAIFLVLLVCFVGVNLNNTCAVSLIFKTYQDVPVYISILIAFAIGMLVMIPFTFGKRGPRYDAERPAKAKPAARKAAGTAKAAPAEPVEPVARPINDD